MHIMTISGQTPGPRDFNWATPGELAFPGFVCCNSDSCGCNRSWGGADSHRAGTVLEVVDSTMSRHDVVDLCRRSLDDSGWTDLGDAAVEDLADTMLDAAIVFNPGVLVRPAFADERWTFDPL